jgi:hypothetical protein
MAIAASTFIIVCHRSETSEDISIGVKIKYNHRERPWPKE